MNIAITIRFSGRSWYFQWQFVFISILHDFDHYHLVLIPFWNYVSHFWTSPNISRNINWYVWMSKLDDINWARLRYFNGKLTFIKDILIISSNKPTLVWLFRRKIVWVSFKRFVHRNNGLRLTGKIFVCSLYFNSKLVFRRIDSNINKSAKGYFIIHFQKWKFNIVSKYASLFVFCSRTIFHLRSVMFIWYFQYTFWEREKIWWKNVYKRSKSLELDCIYLQKWMRYQISKCYLRTSIDNSCTAAGVLFEN